MDKNILPTLLMPVSQAVAWYLVVNVNGGDGGDDPSSLLLLLLQTVWKISFFYMCWALYNRYVGGRSQELGQVSMGLMTVTAYFEFHYLSMAACCLIVVHYGIVVPFLFAQGPKGIAKILYKDETSALALIRAYVFIAYILSNLALWLYILYRMYSNL